jgi:hypothetical protein
MIRLAGPGKTCQRYPASDDDHHRERRQGGPGEQVQAFSNYRRDGRVIAIAKGILRDDVRKRRQLYQRLAPGDPWQSIVWRPNIILMSTHPADGAVGPEEPGFPLA